MKIFTSKTMACLASVFAGACFYAQSAHAFENEIWISPNGLGVSNVAVTNVSSTDVVYGNLVKYPSNIVGTSTYPFRCPDAASLNILMTNVLTNTYLTIHFMGGTFSIPSNGIAPLTGWKLRGAGIDNTTLRLVAGTPVAWLDMIGGNVATENVEVSDMTIDCNLQNQTSVVGALDGVGLWGSNTRISRVKAINWGAANEYECFVFYINASPGHDTATNCIIEDCIVTQPAYSTASAGVSGITIGPNIKSGILRNNMVYSVATGGTGQPTSFNGYTGYNIISHNYAFDLTGSGANAIYADSWTPHDIDIEDNVLDNVYRGVNFNMTASYVTNVVVKNNIVRVLDGGAGIGYYTGEYNQTNAAVTNLIINNNIVYPSLGATNVMGLGINSFVTADVMNNIFQGGGNEPDVRIDYQDTPNWLQPTYPYNVQLNNWAGNVNLAGTQLRIDDDGSWMPGDQDTIAFTPTTNGWYRLISTEVAFASTIVVDSDLLAGTTTDTEFWYHVNAYTSTTNNMGEIVESRRGGSNDGTSNVTKARIGSDGTGGSQVYLDIYIPNVTAPIRPIRVTSKGHFRSKLLDPPTFNPSTPTLSITNNL